MKALLIFINLCLIALAVRAATGQLVFKSEAEVQDKSVELGEVAEVGSPELANLILDDSPEMGKTVWWTASELSKKLHPYQALLKDFKFKIPNKIKITRVEKGFSQSSLKEKIEQALRLTIPQSWEVEISELQKPDWSNLSETAKWRVLPLNQRAKGPSQFEIVIEDQGKILKHVWCNAHIEYFAKVAEVQKNIQMREKIKMTDIAWQRRNVTYVNDMPASEDEIKAGVAKLNLFAGAVVTKSSLDRELAVKFGEEVEMRIGNESFSVSTKGVVQQNAYIGDLVKVRTGNSLKTVSGVVLARGIVKVNL